MPKLIKDGKVIENPWLLIGKDQTLDKILAESCAKLIIPAQCWLDNKQALIQSGKDISIWLDTDEKPDMIVEDIHSFPLIALNFPVFTDGRAYSSAVVIRQHFNYRGELRAIGDILRDQLFYMKRCGFDSYDVSDSVKEEDALTGFSDFTTSYQSTVEEPIPLFKRR